MTQSYFDLSVARSGVVDARVAMESTMIPTAYAFLMPIHERIQRELKLLDMQMRELLKRDAAINGVVDHE